MHIFLQSWLWSFLYGLYYIATFSCCLFFFYLCVLPDFMICQFFTNYKFPTWSIFFDFSSLLSSVCFLSFSGTDFTFISCFHCPPGMYLQILLSLCLGIPNILQFKIYSELVELLSYSPHFPVLSSLLLVYLTHLSLFLCALFFSFSWLLDLIISILFADVLL